MFDLLKELDRFKPYDKNEAEKVKQVKDFLKNNKNCFDRSNLSGHVTAGGLVCDNEGNILLNHHKASGKWFQFGGHSDGEENSLNVAKREIMEEAGIKELELASDKIFDVDVHTIPYSERKHEPEHLHYDINFLFLVKNHDYNISNESIDAKWVSIEEAKSLVDPKDESTTRMIEKYEEVLSNELNTNESQEKSFENE